MTYRLGEFYRVPTVVAEVGVLKRLRWPIIGPWHEDMKYISVPGHHFHIDWRFVSSRLLALCGRTPHGMAIFHDHEPSPIEYRRLKCKRIAPIFPVYRQRRNGIHRLTFAELHEAFQDSSLGPHRQCPHQGASLATVAPVCGVLVCPLHGLCFDAKSSRAIPPEQAIKRLGGVSMMQFEP